MLGLEANKYYPVLFSPFHYKGSHSGALLKHPRQCEQSCNLCLQIQWKECILVKHIVCH